MSRIKRNPGADGIDWDRDDYVLRDITPAKIAVYKNVNGQITILQGGRFVEVSSRDLGWLIQQLCCLASRLGYEELQPQEPPPLSPLRLILRNKNSGSAA